MKKNYTHFKRWYCYLLLLFGALLFSYTGNAQITIDGNPSTISGEWVDVFTDGNIISSFVIDAKRLDGTDNQFTGGTKDYDLATGMYWEWGQVSDKDELTNAAVAVINDTMYFCTDRNSTSGSSEVGFWVFQDGTAPYEAGITPGFENEDKNAFFPAKVYGDMLILAKFTEGGRVPNIEVYQFDPSQKGKKRLIEATVFAEAEVSSATYLVPDYSDPVTGLNWNEYEHKDTKTSGNYYPGSFFEGRVDLLGLPIGIDLCGAWFFFESRNSHSTDAMLNDFVGGTVGASPEIDPVPDIVCVGDDAVLCVEPKEAGRDISESTFYWFMEKPDLNEEGIVILVPEDIIQESSSPCLTLVEPGVGPHSRWAAEFDKNDCCSNLVEVTATVEPRPDLTPDVLTVCENEPGGDLDGTFDLTTAVIGIDESMDVVFSVNGVPIPETVDLTTYAALNGTEVDVDADYSDNTLDCSESTTITLVVEPRPELEPDKLTVCENEPGGDLDGIFNLTSAVIGIDGSMDVVYSVNGTPIPETVDLTSYDALDGTVVNVEADYTANTLDCSESTTITLVVEPRPDLSPDELTVCENITGGELDGTFNLTSVSIGIDETMDVVYSVNGTPIPETVDLTTYAALNGTEVDVDADYADNTEDCTESTTITLHVNPNPGLTEQTAWWCEDGIPEDFNPNNYNADILDEGQDINDFTFDWDRLTDPDLPDDNSTPKETEYNVTVTDMSQPTHCQSLSKLTVTLYPLPECYVKVNKIPTKWWTSDGEVEVVAEGGTGDYTYKWYNHTEDPTHTTVIGTDAVLSDIAGVLESDLLADPPQQRPDGVLYWVEIWDGQNCFTECYEYLIPPAAALNCDVTTEPPICVDGIGLATVSVDPSNTDGPYTYMWFIGDGTGNPVGEPINTTTDTIMRHPGEYICVVTDAARYTGRPCSNEILNAEFVDIELPCPDVSPLEASCQTQDTIDGKFGTWLDGFRFNSLDDLKGIPPLTVLYYVDDVKVDNLDNVPIPDHCGGTVKVEVDVTDFCGTHKNCTHTFTVENTPKIEVDCPEPVTLGECASEATIRAQYDDWVAGFVILEAGCSGATVEGIPPLPADLCGEINLYFELDVSDDCSDDYCSSTFYKPAATPVDAYCEAGPVLADCLSDGDIEAAFQTWKGKFGYKDGCEPVTTNQEALDALDWRDFGNSVDGYNVLFRYKVSDACSNDFAECSFTVPPCDVCETAYGFYAANNECFLNTFTGSENWGWTNNFTSTGEFSIPVYAGTPVCDPTGPEWNGYEVGTATVNITSTDVTVTFALYTAFELAGYHIDDTHVYAGLLPYPQKNGENTISPGQYGNKAGDGIEVTFPTTGGVWVIAHAVVCGPPLPGPEALQSAQIPIPVTFDESTLKVYPNPFSEKVTFEFVSGVDAYGVLEIYNITGQKVARILDRPVEAGVMNRIEYEPEHDVTGIYLYRLDLDGKLQIGRIIYKE
ncbi:T9SS type A sorting domain-containing protein [Draconibacterium halophilum]|uniref:T9SS type A sorting domain-containing protein n=1 Tax=Draconibacterium halophilum TaxID=2706887 RepID=A0A6C0RAK8_9BACT|nr:T9SS type A sorting domain-containing protein [Draconibacterium halophilum]QIA07036.1 T9SS type A sorting domain-containing protein [Draconibacterium halophilum]